MTRCLAVIPARGGSKRLPRKNVRRFAGQPIIKYSIDAALAAGCFAEVMVSTDDPSIARLAKRLRAAVPWLRSATNSADRAGTAAVLLEVINRYRKDGREFDYVCCLYPTAPFITARRLRAARRLLIASRADAVVTVTPADQPPQKALLLAAGRLTMLWPEHYAVRTQDLAPTYYDCNQFYFLTTASLLKQATLYPRFTLPLIVPPGEAQDINTAADWKTAELKYARLHGKKV